MQVVSEPESKRRERALSALKTLVHDLTGIGVDEVDVHASYLESGVDSLLLIQLSQAIQNRFNVKLSLIQLLEEFTTLDTLAAYIDSHSPLAEEAPQAAGAAAAEPAAPPAPASQAPAAQAQPVQTPVADAPPARPLAQPQAAEEQPGFDVPAPVIETDPRETAPRRATRMASSAALEKIVEHQLQLMSQQLSLLHGGRVTGQSPRNVDPFAHAGTAPTNLPTGLSPSAALPPPQGAAGPPPAPEASSAPALAVIDPAARQVKSGPGGVVPEVFTPYKPFQTAPAKGLTPRQQQYLETFIARYNRRTRGSKRLAEQYRPYLADSRNSVGFRLVLKELLYQIVGERSQGARMWDVDGNEYVDITMGFGVHLFGHSPRFLMEAIAAQAELGMQLGPQSYFAGPAAQLVCELTGFERAMFCNSGTEAVMAAMRAARTVTRRHKIAIFTGGYHGWADGTLAKPAVNNSRLRAAPMVPGVPQSAVDDLVVLDFDSHDALAALRQVGHELAAIMVEPVQSRRPDLQPKAFLRELRQIADASGAVLIFDEMITGFRIHPGGAQAVFEVKADLATYGKVVAGGFPIGVIAGKAPFMDALDGGAWQYGDGSYPAAERTLFAGAFFKAPLTMAATVASLGHIKNNHPTLYAELNARSARMAVALNDYFEDKQVPIRLIHFGSLFRFLFPGDLKYSELFFYHMIEKGVFMWEGGTAFLSTAHTDEDVDFIIRAVKQTVEEMQEGGFLPEPPPHPPDGSKRLTGSLPGGGEREPLTPAAPPAGALAGGAATAVTAAGISARGPQPASVSAASHATENDPRASRSEKPAISFSVYYFGKYGPGFHDEKYDLLWEGAKFADRNGFEAVWVPERHFHEFGGFSPNPSVLAAALARETTRIHLRGGSVVLPLHNPIRVAEEWAVVDNLSKGRVGISFASGYRPDDFVFAPDSYEKRRELMTAGIKMIHRLWRGESVPTRAGAGHTADVRLYPMPMQPHLPSWLTSNHLETYLKAGELGVGILTNLHDQSVEDMAGKIAAYREAFARSGHDMAKAHVTVLLHTFLGADAERATQQARTPFYEYLKTSFALLRNVAESQGKRVDFDRLSDAELNHLLGLAYDRYVKTGALIGTPASCRALVDRLIEAGVDEIGCLIDFGVPNDLAFEGLGHLNRLRRDYAVEDAQTDSPNAGRETLILPSRSAALAGAASTDPAPGGVVRFPLSEGQKQLWAVAQMGPIASRAFNESLTLQIHGPLDAGAMRRALQSLVARHPALRTTFSPTGDYQQTVTHLTLEVPLSDFSHLTGAARVAALEEWTAGQAQTPFDLGKGPLLRAHLVKLEPFEHLLALTLHHIAVDGWSFNILLEELGQFYKAERQGVACALPPPMTYQTYTEWQTQREQTAQMEEHETYWLGRYADSFPVLNLPTDRPRPALRTFAGDRLRVRSDGTLFQRLLRLCVEQRVTMFMMMLGAFELMLHRLTGQDDIVVGTPLAGQTTVNGKDLVGFCINEVALRSQIRGDPTFVEFLGAVKREVVNAYEHQHYPFSRLAKRLNAGGAAGPSPHISTVFILDRAGAKLKFHDLEVEPDSNPTKGARVDFHWNVIEMEDHFQLECAFSTDLFDADTILRWMGHYQSLLDAIAANPRRRLSELSLLTPAERQQILYDWNATRADASPGASVERWFEDYVNRSPSAIAVVCHDLQVSYARLNERANQLAHYLIKLGVGPEVIVGIHAARSVDMLVGFLGVLKAGGAYLPLDPAYPLEMLGYILKDSGAAVVLTQGGLAESLSGYGGEVIRLDEDWAQIAAASAAPPAPAAAAGNLAYVIYTSGSTGLPKAVMIRRGALANHALALVGLQELGPDDRHMQFISPNFDASMEEIYPALISGATLVMHRSPAEISISELINYFEEQGLTVVHMPPVYWQQMVEVIGSQQTPRLSALRLLLSGGESPKLQPLDHFARVTRNRVTFLNAYGPTEATITSAIFATAASPEALARLACVPVGRPISNMQVYVLDRQLQPVPVGVVGELYIGGEGVARGYLNRPGLTAEKFTPDPFSATPGARVYCSGDLARYRTDGQVEFLGRADQQVKIRGYRIELGAIESALLRHPDIRGCAVVVRDDLPEYQQMVAYLVASREHLPTDSELRRFLKERLPDYMLPAWFVGLADLPLTATGKLDRQALPKPDATRPELEAVYVAPRTDLEGLIARIWRALLGVDKVGVNDNFFDVGGHSLLVVQTCAQLKEEIGREVDVMQVFQYPTVAALAKHLSDSQGQADAATGTGLVREAELAEPPRPAFANDAIAIIAMAGRFPKAANLGQFWHNLQNGVEGVSFFSDEELLAAGVAPALLADPQYVRASAVLEEVDQFDASFFGYSPREAEMIDPQHRLFLECAWEALELAGYDAETFAGLIGVYGGVSLNTYMLSNVIANPQALAAAGSFQTQIGSDKDFLTTRVSYKLNLRGPSLDVQTACSTSLVAVHLACQALRLGECRMALAGGASVNISQREGYFYQEGGILSRDGHCRAFAADATGTVSGNGVGIVVLKRLSEALADGDRIYAVIKGSAINNDGSTKIGFTAPSITGQAGVIAMAQQAAGVEPQTIGYIEAHGTGTPLGDPIEMAALQQVFGGKTESAGFCAIGSVKTNIGHLDAAAGVTGLIKAGLSLHHKQLPPSLYFDRPNPRIDFDNSPFYVNTELCEWKAGPYPRRAGVSSFGIGGTNAHLILEEAPAASASAPSRPWQLLLWSARTGQALDSMTARLAAHFKDQPAVNLADTAFTLQVGRRVFNQRRMLVCRDREEAATALADPAASRIQTVVHDGRERSVVFMFAGQGAQHVEMAKGLYDAEPAFKAEVDRCADILRPVLGFDLREVIYPGDGSRAQAAERLRQTGVAQPALFVIEYALAKLWMQWGVKPGAMIGHSLGEYVAACLAEVMTLEEALALVAARGRLMQEMPAGGMLAVALSEEELGWLLGDQLSLAAVNGPRHCVISGPTEALDAFAQKIGDGVWMRRLETSHAFHSAMMEPVVARFADIVSKLVLREPKIPYLSNLNGAWITASQVTNARYWAEQLRETVRFADGIAELQCEPNRLFLEVAPGRILTTIVRRLTAGPGDHVTIPSLPGPGKAEPDQAAMLGALGRLWLNGAGIDWRRFYAGERRLRAELPTYPFEKQRYWMTQTTAGLPPAGEPLAQNPSPAATGQRTYDRPALDTAYQAPQNEAERRLATLWGELLGVGQVGIHDNYFDLGGDSIIGLQIVLRANQAGLNLSPQDLFQHQTIAELAAAVGNGQSAAATMPPDGNPDLQPDRGADGKVAGQPLAGFTHTGLDEQSLSGILKKINPAKR